jgi:hypothetical protein
MIVFHENSKRFLGLRSCTILNKRRSLSILVPRLSLGTRLWRLSLRLVATGAKKETLSEFSPKILGSWGIKGV